MDIREQIKELDEHYKDTEKSRLASNICGGLSMLGLLSNEISALKGFLPPISGTGTIVLAILAVVFRATSIERCIYCLSCLAIMRSHKDRADN
jgi:hypothetical protein